MIKRPDKGDRIRVIRKLEHYRELECPRTTEYTVILKLPGSIVGRDDKGNVETFENLLYRFEKVPKKSTT
jgi:hypothetical protein